MQFLVKAFLFGLLIAKANAADTSRQIEFLDRGMVAIRPPDDSVFLSWRWLGDESDSVAFNVYLNANGKTTQLNDAPIADRTNSGPGYFTIFDGLTGAALTIVDYVPSREPIGGWEGIGGIRNSKGEDIGPKPRSSEFAVWWDGDLLREFVSRSGRVSKWDWSNGREVLLFEPAARGAARGPNLVADLIGDWREELLLTAPDGKSLRLYSSTIATEHRMRTLMHDPQYRLGVAWQNVVYNKPAHPSIFLGNQMPAPPQPNISPTNLTR